MSQRHKRIIKKRAAARVDATAVKKAPAVKKATAVKKKAKPQ